ncbi:DNA-binding transcriptional activator of the SARP family [Lentzea xinjiangensis]|uniref:DNA-binding transcriptional activator of the SARP family n=1 Tax=Lentzea xinjiangensis TaxID=402600 RepID=A0A1H9KJS5_9PSEU|nr:BTAD domain-containing putative transcriptional regulator [Lentzea xinjiangensis]SEQ99394.1 DNA-binding transcriptional activator of the SARP family [Lentzea xinjiangensis]
MITGRRRDPLSAQHLAGRCDRGSGEGALGVAVVVRLLGEVSAEVDGRPVDLGTPRQRCVLAALAVDAGRVVPVDRLIERVSGADAAPRSRATLQSYLSRLRRALGGSVTIVRRSGGYALVSGTAEPVTDLHRFRDLCARARGDDAEAVRRWTEALALWQGQPLTGVDGEWADAERDRLSQERQAVEHDLADALLRLGKGSQLLGELSARSARQPLDERVAGQYMLALHQAGRTIDALRLYRQVRARLVDELGTEPGAALQDLHQQLLTADSTPAGGSPSTTPEAAVPRQLPMPPAPFVGRRDELSALDTALDDSSTVAVTAIVGSGGIGKSWLALHWAHRHAHRFPDGQLHVDLRGFSADGEVLHPAAAVRGFLDALGIEPGRMPVEPHAQAALFRSLVADKRMLLVLDNAADTAQVIPLLPGGRSCAVLVTSRNRLPGLVTAHGARHLVLDVLGGVASHDLLVARLGAAQAEAEGDAVEELVRLCGGYPLALSIIAGRVHTRPGTSLSALAAELRESLLDVLDEGDPVASLPAVLSLSYTALTAEQATVFGLLAIAPRPGISLPAAASLTGLPHARTRSVLRGLEQASLITQDASGRYGMHDLIRHYAADAAHRDLAADVREPALRRVVDFYLHTAHTAERLVYPHRVDIVVDPPAPGCSPQPLPDAAAAMSWFDAERRCVLAAQHTAAARGWRKAVWQLAWTLSIYHQLRGHHHDQIRTWQAALVASEHLPDPAATVLGHRQLGLVHAELGRREQALDHLLRALALAEQQHDETAQAHTHTALARAYEQQGDDRRALEHSVRALELCRVLGDPVWEAGALNGVGWFAARLGEHERARAQCLAALAIYRAHDDPSGEAGALDTLGYIAHHAGDHAQAVDHYRQSLALQRQLIYDYGIAEALAGLGAPHAALGQHDEARAVWQEALEIYRQQGRAEEAQRVQRQLDALDRVE